MKAVALFLSCLFTAAATAQPPVAAPADDALRRLALGNGKVGACAGRALDWLANNQNPDGSWGDSSKGAMTGLGLLSFLAQGETQESKAHGRTVSKAVDWLAGNGAKFDGRLSMAATFSQSGVYEHAMATYALCEYYTMGKDERVLPVLKKAVAYIVQGQGRGGGWMYSYDGTADDLSVSGWQIQAIKAAQLTKLDLPGVDAAIAKAMKYLPRMQGPKGGYGYRGAEDRYSLTGAAIYCRLLGGAGRAELNKGMQWLLDETEKSKPVKYSGEEADLYAWYYHTRACLFFGGVAWTKWNRWIQEEIVNAQSPDGSWPVPGGKGHGPQNLNTKTGPVYRTALCTLMLGVFDRQLPTLRQ